MKHRFLLSLGLAFLSTLSAPAADALSSCPPGGGLSEAQRNIIHRSNGVYSLHEAAAAGDTEALAERLREGENPNGVDEYGNCPLHFAARGQSERVVSMLLEAGADVRVADAEGKSPLQLCRNNKVRRLLNAAQKKRERELELDAFVRRGDEASVRKALAAGVNPNARTEDNAGFLLFSAVESGHQGVLRALIEAGANVNIISPAGHFTALHVAARCGNAEAIRTLLAAGGDPMVFTGNSSCPLHEAVWNMRLDAVKALLPAYAGVNFSPDGAHNGFPVNLAMGRGGLPFVRAFLEAGLDPNAPELRRDPPLIRAARDGREDVVRLLLEAGASKDVRDAAGKTAADYAPPALKPLLR